MSAEICDSFEIVVDQTITAGTFITVRNPGRTLRLVSVLVTGQDTAACAVYKNPATGPDVLMGDVTLNAALTPDLTDVPAGLKVGVASQRFLATDDFTIAAAVANITRVVLVCVGNPSQLLTVT
jgi:hypothetical protein